MKPSDPFSGASLLPGARLAVSYASAGEALEVSEQTIRRMVLDGDLTMIRVRESPRIPVAELVRFLNALTEEAERKKLDAFSMAQGADGGG